jgi:hypothetical protein
MPSSQQEFRVIRDSINTLSEYQEQCQKEIPVIHECAETAAVLKSGLPKEFHVIERMSLSLPLIEKERAFLFGQVKAEIQYHLACAAAEKKLASDLQQCSRLLIPPRPPKPKKKSKR